MSKKVNFSIASSCAPVIPVCDSGTAVITAVDNNNSLAVNCTFNSIVPNGVRLDGTGPGRYRISSPNEYRVTN